MTDGLDIARRFYGALQARDIKELLALLRPDFRGHVTAGLPVGLGGTYRGLEAMLRDCWGRVAQIFDARPEPEQFSMRVLMRVFLAEASGVIGGRLVPLLVAAGHEVAGMTRTPGKVDRLRALGVNASGGDVRSSTPPAPPSAPTDHQRSTALKLPVRTEDPSP